MLALLVTSHGSSESCGVKQGTGCSRGLRAITPQKQEVRGSTDPKKGKREKKKENGLGKKSEEKTTREKA